MELTVFARLVDELPRDAHVPLQRLVEGRLQAEVVFLGVHQPSSGWHHFVFDHRVEYTRVLDSGYLEINVGTIWVTFNC